MPPVGGNGATYTSNDPSDQARILPAFDSGDHTHPNDAGYSTMAEAIDLSLFRDDDDD